MADSSTFWVDKQTGTFADPLVAFGLAGILTEVTGGDVTIHDSGPALRLTTKRPLDEAAIAGASGLDLLLFIETKKAIHPEGVPFVNYDHERAVETEYFAARRKLPKRPSGAAPDDYPDLPPPHADLPLFKLVNQMSAVTAYNEVVTRWHADRACWPDYLRLLAELFARHPNDVTEAEDAWKQIAARAGLTGKVRVTAPQIMNPAMGKGGDAPKANSAAPGNKESFWLLEYLKFLGAREAALPLVIPHKDKKGQDRKTYVPLPVRMSLSAHRRVWAQLRPRLWANSAIKMDVLAGLGYAEAFLQQWRDGNRLELDLVSGDPGDFAAGLAVAFYKDMGSALALLNLAQINLPGWMAVETVHDAGRYLDLLHEHTQIVRELSEDHGDEYRLLESYRDFLSARDLEAFYDFAAGYAHLLMSRLERRQPARPFTLPNLEVLIMGHSADQPGLREIVSSPGFRNLATAIRLSTIVPQGQKARKAPRLYDVRYGLGDELKRNVAYRNELAQALSEFVQSYNQETVQVLERSGQQRRKLVTDDDLDQVFALIDQYDSKTVGSLLIAYGYARSPFAEPTEAGSAAEPEEGPDDATPDTSGEDDQE